MTSQDIYLCTTIDLIAAREAPANPSFAYFVNEVQVPLVSPFDPANWLRLKIYIRGLSTHDKAVGASILAVQAVYKAQANVLPTTHAMSAYDTANCIFNAILEDEAVDFHFILIIAFLLCLVEVLVPTETGPVFSQSDGPFLERLQVWSLGGHQLQEVQVPVTLRVVAYLRILHAATRRGGGPRLLSENVDHLLPALPSDLPTLGPVDGDFDASDTMHDTLSAPIFNTFLELQKISALIAELSHYHRSRITSEDQEEVNGLAAHYGAKLSDVWEQRPGIMRLASVDLRTHLSETIAEPLITQIGICVAVYHTEIVELGRTLSDPPLASPEAKQHMRHIRQIIEGDWNAFDQGAKLNPGYLRPLFVYAIESMSVDQTQWAVSHIKQINDPVSRSDFFASFAKSLGEAQRKKERRVTTKWFCYQMFGVPPPYL